MGGLRALFLAAGAGVAESLEVGLRMGVDEIEPEGVPLEFVAVVVEGFLNLSLTIPTPPPSQASSLDWDSRRRHHHPFSHSHSHSHCH